MKLSRPLPNYDPDQVASNQFQIESADRQNHKKDQTVGIGNADLVLTAPDGSRFKVTVDNSGNLSTSAA